MTNKSDKLKVVVDQHRVDPTTILPKMEPAGWSDDPGTGKAILVPDERGAPGYEVVNPMPFAPPIGWEPTPPIEELIRDRVRLEVDRLRDEDEVDSLDDLEDFDVADELPPLETIYEVIAMTPEAPALNQKVDPKILAKDQVDLEELVNTERLLRKRHREAALKKQREELDNLYSPDRDNAEGVGTFQLSPGESETK